MAEKYTYGGPATTPHISLNASEVHFKEAGGDRHNVVKKEKVYTEGLKYALVYGNKIAGSHPGFLDALKEAVEPYLPKGKKFKDYE